jgi:small-conductance mechanosensitive channel
MHELRVTVETWWQIFVSFWTVMSGVGITLGSTRITVAGVFGLLLVAAAAWWFARWTEYAVRRIAARRSPGGNEFPVAYTVARLTRYTVWAIALMIGLRSLGLDLSSLALIGGALGVGIGFGLQNVVSNFVSGVILLVDRSLKIDDFVELESGVRGQVMEVSLRCTRIMTNDLVDILVPNSEFVNGRVTNWTYDEFSRRLRIPFGVAYGTDKVLVREAGLAAAARVPGVIQSDAGRQTDVWLVGFGDSSLNFELLVWLDLERLKHPSATQAKIYWALDDELAARNIEIPFPQRDLRIRSGTLKVDSRPAA